MLNRLTSLAMSTSVLEAWPGKLDLKKHSPSILYIQDDSEAPEAKKSRLDTDDQLDDDDELVSDCSCHGNVC